MISFGNAASSHSGLIPLKTVYKKRGELLGAISSKRQLWQVQTPLSDFLKKTLGTEKHKDKKKKNVMASLRCHGDSDCNKTQIIRNFHLYIIQLW